jgi:hypothetical protein
MAGSIDPRHKDVLAGALFIGLALCSAWLAHDLEIGTPTNMGPGFFPLIVNGLLAAMGLIIIAGAWRCRAKHDLAMAWRPLFVIVGAPVLFALLIQNTGMAIGLGVSVWLSTLAGRRWQFGSSLVLSAAVTLFCWFIFVRCLGVSIPLAKWPEF